MSRRGGSTVLLRMLPHEERHLPTVARYWSKRFPGQDPLKSRLEPDPRDSCAVLLVSPQHEVNEKSSRTTDHAQHMDPVTTIRLLHPTFSRVAFGDDTTLVCVVGEAMLKSGRLNFKQAFSAGAARRFAPSLRETHPTERNLFATLKVRNLETGETYRLWLRVLDEGGLGIREVHPLRMETTVFDVLVGGAANDHTPVPCLRFRTRQRLGVEIPSELEEYVESLRLRSDQVDRRRADTPGGKFVCYYSRVSRVEEFQLPEVGMEVEVSGGFETSTRADAPIDSLMVRVAGAPSPSAPFDDCAAQLLEAGLDIVQRGRLTSL